MSDELVRRVGHVMGMPISLALRGEHARGHRADQAWDDVMAHLAQVDEVFSTYRAESVISRLGRGEIELDDCPPEVHEVLAIGERARRESYGAFDVNQPGTDGSVRLDPSGVVKGWAVSGAAALLEELDATDFCLSAGGDMVCRTQDPESPGWRVGVEDPRSPSHLVAIVPVRDGGIATSGLAHRGAHIRDPRTGAVPGALASVTVVAPTLTWADIDATAAFVLGTDARRWLEQRGRTGVIVTAQGEASTFGQIRSGSGLGSSAGSSPGGMGSSSGSVSGPWFGSSG